MKILIIRDKNYELDDSGFLLDSGEWDEDFASGLAPQLGIPTLTDHHWQVLRYIRGAFAADGRCPRVYDACRASGLDHRQLRSLFPAGYLRGACKLAGITYREGYLERSLLPPEIEDFDGLPVDKTYEVDVRGFLVDPEQWDEYYAVFKAFEMKLPGKLSEEHWNVIRFIREQFAKTGTVATVYDTCEACGVDFDKLERLFPDGYHRGAVKIAGLRVR